MSGMDALDIFRQEELDTAITTDVVVIADLAKAGFACGDELLGRERTITLCGGAVDDDEFYGFKLFHNELGLEQIGCARLHTEGTGNGSDDGCKNLKNLLPS